jgi:hypothetical protein
MLLSVSAHIPERAATAPDERLIFLAIDPLQLHLISEPDSCVSMGLLIVSFNVCSFLCLKLNRGPYREARRAAGSTSVHYIVSNDPT